MGRLDEVDLTLALSKKDEAKQLAEQQERLLRLRLALGGQIGGEIGPALCVVFEGWDASGKGGAIKRLVDHLCVNRRLDGLSRHAASMSSGP